MIASVVATLDDVDTNIKLQAVLEELRNLPCVELGDIDDAGYRIPMTIDSPAPNALEETTRRIQECHGVAFVDVVFVHFEDMSEDSVKTISGKSVRS